MEIFVIIRCFFFLGHPCRLIEFMLKKVDNERILVDQTKHVNPTSLYTDVDQMVLHADGFAGVYSEHKYEIVERLQNMGHMTAMTGDGVNDAPALSKANVGVAVADASDTARSAADIVLTAPGLSTIVEAIIGSRQIIQRMRNYSIYTCSVTIRVVVGFSILIWAFQFDFPLSMVLIMANSPLTIWVPFSLVLLWKL
ncbi:unnamed protein product [Mucor hiemalis]